MMYTIEQLREVIKAELDKQEYVEEPYSLFEPIKYIMEDGGKRLRPVLTLMAYNLYRDDIGKALKSAIGIEIFIITPCCMTMLWTMPNYVGDVRLSIKNGIVMWLF